MKVILVVGILVILASLAYGQTAVKPNTTNPKTSTPEPETSTPEPEGKQSPNAEPENVKAEPEVEPEVVYGILGALLAAFVLLSLLFFMLWRQAKSTVLDHGVVTEKPKPIV